MAGVELVPRGPGSRFRRHPDYRPKCVLQPEPVPLHLTVPRRPEERPEERPGHRPNDT